MEMIRVENEIWNRTLPLGDDSEYTNVDGTLEDILESPLKPSDKSNAIEGYFNGIMRKGVLLVLRHATKTIIIDKMDRAIVDDIGNVVFHFEVTYETQQPNSAGNTLFDGYFCVPLELFLKLFENAEIIFRSSVENIKRIYKERNNI